MDNEEYSTVGFWVRVLAGVLVINGVMYMLGV